MTGPSSAPDASRRAGNTAMAQAVIDCCRTLASFSEKQGETTRTFLSPPMRDVHAHLADWMTRVGLDVQVDAAGNLRGCSPVRASAPRLLIGSHLDTVPNAGAFDGILGVVMGIALVDLVGARHLPYAIEVIGFSEEEGVRFGVPFIGSRALVGSLGEDLLARTDASGCTVQDAIRTFGLDPAQLPAARLTTPAIGYLEFHIEQGPVLESHGCSLGVVDAIVGQSRLVVTFTGAANHAGTTPMALRRDSLAAAAEFVGVVERVARACDGLVATVGRIEAQPGATNVIAGQTRATLDVRHADDILRRQTVNELLDEANRIAARRQIALAHDVTLDQPATPLDPTLVRHVENAAKRAAVPVHRMASGAGHDAMVVAPLVPAAMLFVRSPRGISHHPDESVLTADVADALAVGVELLHLLAQDAS